MNWRRLEIEIDGLDCDSLLSDWRWLVPDGMTPVSMTIFGDWFLEDRAGRVHLLDTVGGKLSEIAPSRSAFLVERERPENLDEWSMADFARLCWRAGFRPSAGQCLSFKVPPVLGGSLDLENVEVCELMVHQSVMGQIHLRVKDLPEGTVIDQVTVDGEVP